MVVTEDRLAEVQRLESIWESSAPPLAPAPSRRRSLDPLWTFVLRRAWIVVLAGIWLFQPTPSHPDAAVPAWAAAAGVAVLISLGAMFWAMAHDRAWGFGASAIAGGLGMSLAYECRASGHHLGAWWMVELGVFTALTVASLVALRSARRSDRLA